MKKRDKRVIHKANCKIDLTILKHSAGVKVVCQYAEAFGKRLDWFDVSHGEIFTWASAEDCCLEAPGLLPQSGGVGYCGYCEKSDLWWRHQSDVEPKNLHAREHCVRILQVIEYIAK